MDSPETVSDPWIGVTIAGKYTILEKLGAGGMGGVYKAEHGLMNRFVAIKLLGANFRHDEISQKRFQQEARAASRLSHPHAVTLHDFGIEGETPYLVMELIEGSTLKALLNSEGRLPLPRVREILKQTCDALADAHALGMIHRDLKPENIMMRVREDGREWVKVLDFGIAKVKSVANIDANLTAVGIIIGTPQYMSPEQCQVRELDNRSDIFSLGIMLYEMISGDRPFYGDSTVDLLIHIVSAEVTPLTELELSPPVPAAVNRVVMKALEKDPNKRYASVRELYADFEKAVPDLRMYTGTLSRAAVRVDAALATFSSSGVNPVFTVGACALALCGLGVAAYLALHDTEASTTVVPGSTTPKLAGTPAVTKNITSFLDALRSGDEAARKAAVKELLAIGSPEAKNAVAAYESAELAKEEARKAETVRMKAMLEADMLKAETARLAELARQAEEERTHAVEEEKKAVPVEVPTKEDPSLEVARRAAQQQKAEEAKRLAEQLRKAQAERADALRRAEEARREAQRRSDEANQAIRERQRVLEKSQQEQQNADDSEAVSGQTTRKPKRRRCGPNWCQ